MIITMLHKIDNTNTICVFPGQGSQYIGMGKEVFDGFTLAKTIFLEADEVLGFKLSDLMFFGSEDELRKTENAQPALLVASIAILRVLENLYGKKINELCKFVAGHSLGEYTALCAAGVISFADAVRIVRRRGELMRDSCPNGSGGMVAIIGLEIHKIDELIVAVKLAESGELVVANDNSVGQIVLSGSIACTNKAAEIAKSYGAKMAVALPVSGPFHSPLMLSAADKMADVLGAVQFVKSCVPIIANVTANVAEMSEIKSLLVQQITGSVRWRESMLFAQESGVVNLVEIGSKNVLCGLAKRTVPNVSCISVEKKSEIESFGTNVA